MKKKQDKDTKRGNYAPKKEHITKLKRYLINKSKNE
jgi:hypothetical protein